MIRSVKPPHANRVRYAVVGLGWIAQAAVLPAFRHAKRNSQLAAIVSGDPAKRKELGETYNLRNVRSYEEYEGLLRSGDIDAVYLALPNNMHREYTEKAAAAGVHVLCEKPMAVTEEDCRSMIRMCDEGKVKLMIAYRLHFEEANVKAVELVKSGHIGEPRVFSSVFSQQVMKGNIRVEEELGGGTLDDMGIYCINAARYIFRDEPIEGWAMTGRLPEPRFEEVEEMASVVLRFPRDRLATFTCSFGAPQCSTYEVLGTQGRLRLDPAYTFQTGLRMELTVRDKTKRETFIKRDQFAAELLHFSDCILENRLPSPSGWEGLADVHIIRSLYRSVEERRPIQFEPIPHGQRPDQSQAIRQPPVQQPQLVNAAAPSDEG